ncbi:MAG: GIY-YIG nuclease family protein [Gammaproteobacteria bacterium]
MTTRTETGREAEELEGSPVPLLDPGYCLMNVYFLRTCDNAQLIKIGKAKDVTRRVAEIQTGCPSKLEILGTIPLHSEKHAQHIEGRLHRAFKRYHVRGEWYRAGKPLREFIAAVTAGSYTDALSALKLMN